MKKLIFFLFLLVTAESHSQDCHYYFDYSDTNGWTQIGTLVEIQGGQVLFINGAPDGSSGSSSVGIQRRVHYSLGTSFDSNDTWTAELDFLPLSVGIHSNGQPHTGHTILALTAGDQEPFNNCIDLPCNGFPTGTQDGIILIYATDNPPTGNIYFSVRAKDSASETSSTTIVANTLGVSYYPRVQRTSSTEILLSIFSDSQRTNHIPGSPITFIIPSTVEGITHIQHGNNVRGQVERELTGIIDNLCIVQDNIVGFKELSPTSKKLVQVIDLIGRETEDKPNTLLIYIYDDGTTEKVFRVE